MNTLHNGIQNFLKSKDYYFHMNEDNELLYKLENDSEIKINFLPKTNEYNIVVPIGSINYRKKFYDTSINTMIEYIKMHMNNNLQ